MVDRFKCSFGQLVSSKFFKKRYKKSDGDRNLFAFMGVIYLGKEFKLDVTKTRVRNKAGYRWVMEELTTWLKGDRQDEEKVDLNALYEMRFSLGRESGRKMRKE